MAAASRSRLLALASASAAMLTGAAFAATPAQANATLQLYVTQQGDDTGSCTHAQPCKTIERAVTVAATTPAVIHVAAGVYHGSVAVANGQDITLEGAGDDARNGPVTSLENAGAGPTIVNAGSLDVSKLYVNGGAIGVQQTGGTLGMSSVQDSSDSGLVVEAGTVTLRNVNLLQDVDLSEQTSLTLSGGSITGSRLRLNNTIITGGQLAGRVVALFGQLQVTGGSAVLRRSSLGGGDGTLTVSGTGAATLVDSWVEGEKDSAVDVEGDAATAELVSDTLSGHDGNTLVQSGGTLEVAASVVLDHDNSAPACSGTVVDGGYNASRDASCAFSAPTSHNSATGIRMHALELTDSDPTDITAVQLEYAAPKARNVLVNAIPPDATAGFDSSISLCASQSLDERGQPRPVSGACEIGSVELSAVRMTVSVSPRPVPKGKVVTIKAHVFAPRGAPDLEPVTGHVGFVGAPFAICGSVPISTHGMAICQIHTSKKGYHAGRVRFTPTDAFEGRVKRVHFTVR